MWKPALTLCVLAGTVCPIIAAQEPAIDQAPTIRTTTREVILDVIVRDKHHHAVSDLRPDEIEVFEDGVKQTINSFRDVRGAEQLQEEQAQTHGISSIVPSTVSKPPATALPQLNFVSVVFAEIAPLNLEFAREAVQDFLRSGSLPNTYVTVYRLDRTLQLIQPYTSDQKSLLSAVNAAAKGFHKGSQFGASATVASALDATVQANAANIMASPLISPQTAQSVQAKMADPIPDIVNSPLWARNAASQDASLTLGSALVAQAHLATGLRFAESLSNGMDAFDALRELIRIQAKLPGRKVVLYLADGLTLPTDRRDVVNSVISFANQSEVAFYAVDTRGLSVEDPVMASLTDQQRAGAESAANRVSPRIGHTEEDDVQLSLSSDKQLAMEELAESTGGFAVTNTNEIAPPMKRVMEDIRTHYELAYKPSSNNYDGHFRRIRLHVTRPRVSVQTRSGYFAVPDLNGEPMQPFEVKALHAINARPSPVEFPYRTALLRFRPKSDAVEYQVLFDIPISSLRLTTNPKTDKVRVRASALALIRNSDGQVVGKVSSNLEREILKKYLPHHVDDHILYTEPIELPGGHYLIDTAVTDELSDKTSVQRISAFVDSGRSFGVSSLELVQNIQPLPVPRDQRDPFQTDSGRIVPTLANSVSTGKPIDVYFVVYPTAISEAEPTITLKLYRDGHEVGLKILPTPERQADGSMPMLVRITPDPGQCDMIVTAHQGPMKSEAMLSVSITPNQPSNAN